VKQTTVAQLVPNINHTRLLSLHSLAADLKSY